MKSKFRELKLYTAKGALEATIFLVSTAISASAARPKDVANNIIASGRRMSLEFPDHPVFKLPGFHSDLYLTFCAEVKVAEDSVLLSATGIVQIAAAEPLMAMVQEALLPSQQHVVAQLALMREQQRQQNDFMHLILARLDTIPLVVPPAALPTPAAPSVHADSEFVAPSLPPLASPGSTRPIRPNRRDRVDASKGHHHIPYLMDMSDAHQIWTEYNVGTNSNPALRKLEEDHGTKWRDYPSGGKRWSEFAVLPRFIEGLVKGGLSEEDAVRKLQEVANEVGHRGKSKVPDWGTVSVRIKKSRVQVAATAPFAEDHIPTEVRADGSVVEAPEVDPNLHGVMAFMTGI